MSNKNLEASVYKIEFIDSYAFDKDKSAYSVQIEVLDGDETIGDFFVDFVEGPLRVEEENKRIFVANPDDVKYGNKKYIDEKPEFRFIEDIAEELDKNGSGIFEKVRDNHGFKAVRVSK